MTKAQAVKTLAAQGIVWDIGQLDAATRRHLDGIGDRHAAVWPYFWAGTARKACWLSKGSPLALALEARRAG